MEESNISDPSHLKIFSEKKISDILIYVYDKLSKDKRIFFLAF